MSATERLQYMQSALEARKLRDVKFCFSTDLTSTPLSKVTGNVSDFLDAYLHGRYALAQPIGDTPVGAAPK